MISRLAAALGVLLASAGVCHAGVLRSWTEYGAGGDLEARAIVDQATCPSLTVDGAARRMDTRHVPDATFPVRVCAARVPLNAKVAVLEGRPLPLPAPRPARILVIGDTGCRLKGSLVQACNDPSAWPFPAIAVAAAKAKPDLVIHVGDYLYRETACKGDDSRCAGTPWGDNWPTWDADFFQPAAPLLQAAPWLMVRGNHEDCHRAGAGWTALLAPDPATSACTPHDRPRLLTLGGRRIAVVDDNNAADTGTNAAVVRRLHDDIRSLLERRPDWLLLHHPLRGVVPAAKHDTDDAGSNATLLAALRGLDDSHLQLVLSGHIHTFEAIDYDGGRPPQLVAGMGGDLLDGGLPVDLAGHRSGEASIQSGLADSSFGYVLMDRQGRGWTITLHSLDGTVRRSCVLNGRRIDCQTPSKE